ncbi:hypothetical protein V2J09_022449 [Rumex salicifolius]
MLVLKHNLSNRRWVIVVSVIMRKMISLFALPMKWIGYFTDFTLNLLYINGNFVGLISNFIQGKVSVPQRDTKTFISSIGHLDGRIDLLKMSHLDGEDDGNCALLEHGSKALMDLCILASKLAYENVHLVNDVVVNHWKMHFVDFYNCWNDFQKRNSTQVFIMRDKPKEANLILVSFRGSEPFDADDWSTDFDYSWYEIPNVGKVHMGFVEAMGLGNREDSSSIDCHLLAKLFTSNGLLRGPKSSTSSTDTSLYMGKLGAYYMVRDKLKGLLIEHKNAKVVVTGHSLGGALAILFPVVLVLQKEDGIMRRMLGVYTFGQPRIGDRALGKFMEAYLNKPNCPNYVRVVYCNDIVPRIPCDDTAFLFKHFGKCLYYNSLYKQKEVDEEPDKNYFGCKHMILAHLNAVWELIRAFVIGYTIGPEYEECWFSIWLRLVGLVLPGFSAHSPRDYVNAIRLEPSYPLEAQQVLKSH